MGARGRSPWAQNFGGGYKFIGKEQKKFGWGAKYTIIDGVINEKYIYIHVRKAIKVVFLVVRVYCSRTTPHWRTNILRQE